jgi:hypothetical protein
LTPAEARTVLELGTLATQSGTFSGTSSGTNTGDQNLFSTIVVAGQSDVVADATGDTLTLVAGTNISITTNAGSDSITINNTASGLSGTGSVDNAVLRADGTGGATLQNSNWIIADNATASPNNTVNHASIQATGGTTNVSVSIVPKGTGAFTLAVPDGTTTGGNVRGINSIDLQTARNNAIQVASGENSFVGPGPNGRASGDRSVSFSGGTASANDSFAVKGTASATGAVALGVNTIASGLYAAALAFAAEATTTYAVSVGAGSTASGQGSFACGQQSNARIYGSFAFASLGDVSGRGNKQMMMLVLRNSTSGTTPAELFADASSARLTVPSGKVLQAMIFVSGSKNDGSAVATYSRMYAVKNVGGTTSEVFAPQTLGSDTAAGTSIAITADNTNDALQISVTGIAGETWRWQAFVMWSEFIWAA